MKVRRATVDDVSALADMGVRFIERTGYAGRLPLDRDTFAFRLMPLVTHPAAFIAVTNDAEGLTGAIGAAVAPDLFTDASKVLELFWWVEPRARGAKVGSALFDALTAWATESGAVSLGMIEPPNAPEVASFYERRGLKRLETTWEMKLWQPLQASH